MGIVLYNHEKYILKCLELIVKQLYKDIELITVNTDEIYGPLNEINLFMESTPYSSYSTSKTSSDIIIARAYNETNDLFAVRVDYYEK